MIREWDELSDEWNDNGYSNNNHSHFNSHERTHRDTHRTGLQTDGDADGRQQFYRGNESYGRKDEVDANQDPYANDDPFGEGNDEDDDNRIHVVMPDESWLGTMRVRGATGDANEDGPGSAVRRVLARGNGQMKDLFSPLQLEGLFMRGGASGGNHFDFGAGQQQQQQQHGGTLIVEEERRQRRVWSGVSTGSAAAAAEAVHETSTYPQRPKSPTSSGTPRSKLNPLNPRPKAMRSLAPTTSEGNNSGFVTSTPDTSDMHIVARHARDLDLSSMNLNWANNNGRNNHRDIHASSTVAADDDDRDRNDESPVLSPTFLEDVHADEELNLELERDEQSVEQITHGLRDFGVSGYESDPQSAPRLAPEADSATATGAKAAIATSRRAPFSSTPRKRAQPLHPLPDISAGNTTTAHPTDQIDETDIVNAHQSQAAISGLFDIEYGTTTRAYLDSLFGELPTAQVDSDFPDDGDGDGNGDELGGGHDLHRQGTADDDFGGAGYESTSVQHDPRSEHVDAEQRDDDEEAAHEADTTRDVFIADLKRVRQEQQREQSTVSRDNEPQTLERGASRIGYREPGRSYIQGTPLRDERGRNGGTRLGGSERQSPAHSLSRHDRITQSNARLEDGPNEKNSPQRSQQQQQQLQEPFQTTRSYPSDIDFLEDAFDSTKHRGDDRLQMHHLHDTHRTAAAASPARSFRGVPSVGLRDDATPRPKTRMTNVTPGGGTPKPATPKAAHTTATSTTTTTTASMASKLRSIRNLNGRASVMLSQLGASAHMTYNSARGCWEGGEEGEGDEVFGGDEEDDGGNGEREKNAEGDGSDEVAKAGAEPGRRRTPPHPTPNDTKIPPVSANTEDTPHPPSPLNTSISSDTQQAFMHDLHRFSDVVGTLAEIVRRMKDAAAKDAARGGGEETAMFEEVWRGWESQRRGGFT
ncbi:uncharacterized protein EV422DRAFT_349878 [Fimicolochytrium jonesii]|uniref:uncharacterized protein n=1 Tax=Fimicolochytrium jonesii TaxID=1396493 RepID=UPI0022FEECBF|nr:uncharacterized protein EV422DRAFT_349878 [Fimicolochytrium jonesii]KAI8815618.1 hypothetical protein EV422DRAFT_349878 [Fimicolochytrium jonesii]